MDVQYVVILWGVHVYVVISGGYEPFILRVILLLIPPLTTVLRTSQVVTFFLFVRKSYRATVCSGHSARQRMASSRV